MSQSTLGSQPFQNSNLFSSYYLKDRIGDLDGWDCDETAEDAFERLGNLWELESGLVAGYNEDELLDTWIDKVVDVLGFDSLSETTLPDSGGYTDRLLFESPETRRDAATRKRDGDSEAMFGLASVVLEAKQWDADFTTRFAEQRSYRDASHQIKYYLEHTPERLQWGILTNGRKWRLYGTKDYATEIYYEVDLPELLESGDVEQFKYFYTFFRCEAFRETAGTSFLYTVWSESETAAQQLGEDLQDNVFTALRVLGEGFVETNDLDIDPDDDAARAELKEQSLVFLYRLMFVLYAESRGLIHPDDPAKQVEYDEHFSLEQCLLDVHDDITSGDSYADFSGYSTGLWSRLQDLFDLIDKGEKDLGIPPYNGGLFDDDTHAFLADKKVADRYLAEVIHRLGTTESDAGKPVTADYADLDTRHLGSIYEGLLEHEFRIAPEQYAAVDVDGGEVWKPATEVSVADAVETVPEGGLYVVNDDGERKATGAYYTPDYVVSYIVEETVDPLIAEIKADLAAEGMEPGDRGYFAPFFERVKDLTVLDPAMGSGHFLTSATAYLTEQVMEVVRAQEIQSYDEQDLRRQIAKECIYGVDINGMAVELGKLSMWLETLAADKPLAFLDHHLKAGNSLVGSDITAVLADDGDSDEGQLTLGQALARARQQTLGHVMDLMQDLLAIDNERLEDIKSMEELYDEIRDDPLYKRLFEIANVHTAAQFGCEVPDGAYEKMAGAVDDAEAWAEIQEAEWYINAQALADEQSFFHWELEYPEVFFGEDGEKLDEAGFDAVVGNPPYIRIQELRTHAPTQAEYHLSQYESSTQNFDIYVNFTEQGYQLLRPNGYLGYIEPHKFFQSEFGKGLRKYISDRNALYKILSFGHEQVFENASVYTCLIILSNSDNRSIFYAKESPRDLKAGKPPKMRKIEPELGSNSWAFQSPEQLAITNKIESTGQTLADATKKIYQGIITSSDDTYIVKRLEDYGDTVLIKNGHDEEYEVEKDILHPLLKGKDINRYSPPDPPLEIILPYDITDDDPIFLREEELHDRYPKTYDYFSQYESELRSRDSGGMDHDRWYDFTRAQNMGEFLNQKLVTPDISYGGNFTLDSSGIFHKSAVYGIVAADWVDELYLLSILNSNLLWFYLQGTGNVLRGGYFRFKTDYLEPFGILSESCVKSKSISTKLSDKISLFSDEYSVDLDRDNWNFEASLNELVSLQLQTKSRLEKLNRSLLDHLGSYSEGPTLVDIGLPQPPQGAAGSILQQTATEKPNLRVGEASVVRESPNTVEIRLTARYKPSEDEELDESEFETDQWGYTETEPLAALRLTDLTTTEVDLIEAFVPVAVDEAGGFAGFREKVTKTNSLVDRLRKLTLPEVDDIEAGLEGYIKTKERAEELEAKIEKTDALIDEIVYELYGLTDEEIEIVEEAVGE